MATDRRDTYEGRWWALKTNEEGQLISVHHFSSQEVRDGWVAMDQELREAVDQRHTEIRRWLAEDPDYKPTRWERISLAWRAFWKRVANTYRRST